MWHGQRARLHPGSVVTVLPGGGERSGGGSAVEGQQAFVVRYVQQDKGWVVKLQGGKGVGQFLVDEDKIALDHTIIPHSLDTTRLHPALQTVEGAHGRGLTVTRAVSKGEVLFEEEPMLVTPTGVTSMHRARWRCLLLLNMAARSNPSLQRLSHAFNRLTPGHASDEEGTRRVREEAAAIVEEAVAMSARAQGTGATLSPEARQEQEKQVFTSLLRFQRNQFRFENGVGPVGAAAAVYGFTASMNHCCAPSVIVKPTWAPRQPGELVDGDGKIVAKAACDLSGGEALCINYGPKDLPQWPAARRRAYLLQHNGFWCGCLRCMAEDPDAKPPAPAAASKTSEAWFDREVELDADLSPSSPLPDEPFVKLSNPEPLVHRPASVENAAAVAGGLLDEDDEWAADLSRALPRSGSGGKGKGNKGGGGKKKKKK